MRVTTTYKKARTFNFNRPTEAPVYRPTKAEFQTPLEYIDKIRPDAEKYGICKIIPPKGWKPPSCLNEDTFQFVPRNQELSKLDSVRKEKDLFYQEYYKYWDYVRKEVVRIPKFGGESLDVHKLHQEINSEKYKHNLADKATWDELVVIVGANKRTGYDGDQLKTLYEKILSPFESWMEEEAADSSRAPKRFKPNKEPSTSEKTSFEVGEERFFENSKHTRTLKDFRKLADNVKKNYFAELKDEEISVETIEKEFWRVVTNPNDVITVEYGADLDSAKVGSGFPTNPAAIKKTDMKYFDSGWNLNNIKKQKGSVFKHLKEDISGMNTPWIYVGMVFSTFCWHVEDHWSYSINYLHQGAPKTWYGIPGESAGHFETVLKSTAPELFKRYPEFIHSLVTMVNPNVLMDEGVPVFRLDQNPGEFVVTFPRAYHAGFNNGFNVAEATNFSTADWIAKGRKAIENYSKLSRSTLFSHDELICKLAVQEELMKDKAIADAVVQDLLIASKNEETALRIVAKCGGINKQQKVKIELLPDSVRQCLVCKTDLYLSALVCKCSGVDWSEEASLSLAKARMVCLNHWEGLCEKCHTDDMIILYRFSVDELKELIGRAKQLAEQ